MSMPAVQALRQTFPDARISWLVEGSVGALLPHQPFIDKVIRFPRGSATGALRKGNLPLAKQEMGRFLKELRADEYDVIVIGSGLGGLTGAENFLGVWT